MPTFTTKVTDELYRKAIRSYHHLTKFGPGLVAAGIAGGAVGGALYQQNENEKLRRNMLTPVGELRVLIDGEGLQLSPAPHVTHRVAWTTVDRWLEDKAFYLLVTTNGQGIILPKDGIPPLALDTVTFALTKLVGEGVTGAGFLRSDDGPIVWLLKFAGKIVLGVLAVFVALGAYLWITDYDPDAPTPNNGCITVVDQSGTRVECF